MSILSESSLLDVTLGGVASVAIWAVLLLLAVLLIEHRSRGLNVVASKTLAEIKKVTHYQSESAELLADAVDELRRVAGLLADRRATTQDDVGLDPDRGQRRL